MDKQQEIEKTEKSKPAGKLKIYFAYAHGAGATSSMLDDALEYRTQGKLVYFDHVINPTSKEVLGEDFELADALERKPDLVVVDRLARESLHGDHKECEDVEKLLEAGIDVFATLLVIDLSCEKELLKEISGIENTYSISDDIFEIASEVEFVDIDPQELHIRREALGNEIDLEQLRKLRAVAIEKINAYAHVITKNYARYAQNVSRNINILVPIRLDGTAEKVLHEASSFAKVSAHNFQVIHVDVSSRNSFNAKNRDAALEKISKLVERLGGEFNILYGDDELAVLVDYAQVHNITDIFISRRRLKKSKKRILPFLAQREDKLARFLPNVVMHTIPVDSINKELNVKTGYLHNSFFKISLKDVAFSLVSIVVATVLIYILSRFGFTNTTAVLIYLLATTLIAVYTSGYLAGIMSTVLALLAFNFFFVVPKFQFVADQPANYFTFIIFLIVSLITTTLSTQLQKTSERSTYREQHTQMLYELNKSMLTSRGIYDVVNTTLDTITRIFDRAAVFYTANPYSSTEPKTKPALNDANVSLFKEPAEKEAAKKAYLENRTIDTESDAVKVINANYYPISVGDSVRGVVGVSMRNGKISKENQIFLDMVINQVAIAFERQLLNEEHKMDILDAQVDIIRANFSQSLASYAASSSRILRRASEYILASRIIKDSDPQAQNRSIEIIRQESKMVDIVSETLSAVHSNIKDSNAPSTRIDLAELVQKSIKYVRSYLKDVPIIFEDRGITTQIIGDKPMLIRAIADLIFYASLNSPENGKIDVSLRVYKDQASISIADERIVNNQDENNKVIKKDFMVEREKEYMQELDLFNENLNELHSRRLAAENKDSGDDEALEADEIEMPDDAASKAFEDYLVKIEQQEQLSSKRNDEVYLVIAASIFKSHGGSVRIRKRLGGGAVTTAWIKF